MDREYKGHGQRSHANDYCVLDLETTGIFVSSAKIIEISAIRIRKTGEIITIQLLRGHRFG